MASNFLKRAGKAQEPVTPEVQVVAEEPTKTEDTYPQSGFDIYTSDGGRNYFVAEIKYNPETGEAKVVDTFDISRLVALSYMNQRGALNSLKKRKKK